MVHLGAQTLLDSFDELSPGLADGLRNLLANTGVFDKDIECQLEEWLSRTWSRRDFDLGPSDFSSKDSD
ncbi:hypothetical protein GCM10023321_72430 [Pseudonocardia eucalypti]|uniref:Uncharacterized protein n=1 Tax=Pseudonocardia eucalypti TaxID=648755 RepID=A0ABP9R8Q1_9PSEU